MTETELMLNGYGLTTAEMYFRLPDYQHVLNSYPGKAMTWPLIIPNSSSLWSSGRTNWTGRYILFGSPIEN